VFAAGAPTRFDRRLQRSVAMSSKERGKGFRRVPVTVLIFVLIIAVAAPSLAFTALLLLQADNVTRASMQLRAAQGVDGIADTLERDLRNMSTNLALLASSGWIEAERYESLHARATEALKGTDSYLIAVDAQNQQILNTRVPWGAPLGVTSNPASVDRAVALGKPAVSDLFFGQTAQKQVFNVVMPIISGESRVKALILTRDADKLPGIFRERPPPPGWSYAVLDGSANLVAGSAPAGPPDLLDKLCSVGAPGLNQMTANGVQLAASAEQLQEWGWRACAWTSSDQTETSISERWRVFTVVVLVVVSVTLLLGALLGRTLTSAIRRAAAVGRALDMGGEVPASRSRVREVDELLGTLTRAARRRLQQEEDLKVLLRETAHRAKNQIAIASALARLSAKSAQSKDELRDDIVARLSALGRSIDTMSKTPSGAVLLKELAEAQLAPFASDQPGRLRLQGAPEIRVAPGTAQSLGLVFHELGTNAAKYGAWSKPEGRIELDWVETAEGLTVTWRECDGPAIIPPSRSGFGSSLIEMMIERNIGGSIERDYRDTGLVVTLKLPERPLTV
jgi:two-component sensor histidine kinase